jgi:DNA-binding NtrC family response regulator
MKILVVDDEEVQLEVIGRGLQLKKFEVVTALGGHEALMHLEGRDATIDLVITDFSMPGMDGIELLRRIRERNCRVPIIIMTGFSDKDLGDVMKKGWGSVIEKPFSLEDLLKKIDHTLEKA